jgi:hypothetical protein
MPVIRFLCKSIISRIVPLSMTSYTYLSASYYAKQANNGINTVNDKMNPWECWIFHKEHLIKS